MAKLGLMLGLLWAVGCCQLANTLSTAATTTASSTTTTASSISGTAKLTTTAVTTTTIKTPSLLSASSKPEGSTMSTSTNVKVPSTTTVAQAPGGTTRITTSNAAPSVNTSPTLQTSSSNIATTPSGPSQSSANHSPLSTAESRGPSTTSSVQSKGDTPTTSSVQSKGDTPTVSPLANKYVSATSEQTRPSEKAGKPTENTSPTSIPSIPGHTSVKSVNISAGSISNQTSTRPSQSPANTFQTFVKSSHGGPTSKLPSVISTSALKPSLKPTTNAPITDKSKVTSEQAIQITCQNTTSHKNYPLTINIKTDGSWNCNEDMNSGNLKNNVEQVCKAIKPGFQASTDTCKVVLGHNTQNDKISVVQAVVETKSDTNDLYLKLKTIKNEDGTPMFAYNDEVHNTEYNDWLSMTLIITIVCLAASLLIIAAIYGCWHQRRSQKRDQRLTEELQTMENGYHDNPTLEVMETSPEMQEKKGGLNGELGDSWIVPLDNLTREDLDEEEDTHL